VAKPAGAVGPHAGDKVRPHVHEGGAGSARHPLEASAHERVAAHRVHVERDAAAGLVAVDQAEGAGAWAASAIGRTSWQVAGRVEEVGRRHQARCARRSARRRPSGGIVIPSALGTNSTSKSGRESHWWAQRREVQLPDQDLLAAGREGQARSQGGQGDGDRGGDRRGSRRGVQQAPDPGAKPLEQREPVGEPDGGALGNPSRGRNSRGRARPRRGEGSKRAGVEVDVPVPGAGNWWRRAVQSGITFKASDEARAVL